MRKPLLVGEAPSRTSDPDLPFDGRTGRRVEELLPRPLRLHDVFETRNLLDEWPGGAHKGSAFDFSAARERAIDLVRREWTRSRLFVLCGRRVARVFALGSAPYLEVVGVRYPAVVFPHPSGVDRWWNEPENVDAARLFLHKLTLTVVERGN